MSYKVWDITFSLSPLPPPSLPLTLSLSLFISLYLYLSIYLFLYSPPFSLIWTLSSIINIIFECSFESIPKIGITKSTFHSAVRVLRDLRKKCKKWSLFKIPVPGKSDQWPEINYISMFFGDFPSKQ
jgi:hypothetical protein